MRARFGLAVCILSVLTALAASSPLQAAARLGFCDQNYKLLQDDYLRYDRYRLDLLRQGIDAALAPLPMDPEELRPFHVLVYGGWSEDPSIRVLDAATRKRAATERAALEDYVRSGGGLIVLPAVRRYPGQAVDEYYNLVLQGLGARVLQEGVWDARNNFLGPDSLAFPPMPFFMAANIKDHPITRGVKRLALPQSHNARGPVGVAAMTYDDNWEIVAAGGPEAGSYKVDSSFRLDVRQPGAYRSSPPVVAVRTFGKGRVVSYPISLTYVSLNWGNPSWPHTVETQGNVSANEPSDSQRLVLNAIKWAAEPSQGIETFGRAARPSSSPPHLPDSVALPKSTLQAYKPQDPYRGIIGAHTALSDGRGTPEDYARIGASEGLHFIVFTEALEHLSSDSWRTLVRQCQEVNRKGGIYLVPGYEYTDVNGCRWASWGEQLIYPQAAQWTKDRKRLFRTGEIAYNSNFGPRMLLTYDKLPGDPSNLWWYYQLPLWVYDEGKLQADNLGQYLLAQDNLFAVPAACFTRIRTPEAVADAARLCVLNVERNRYPAVRPAIDTALGQWTSWTYPSQGGKDGPKLEWVACEHAGTSVYRTRGTQRWRGAFVARAAAGLKEIRIHDGTSGLVRRYLCHGVSEFRQVLELALDRQHYLVLEAVDMGGRRAVYSAQRLFFYEQGLYRCRDNLNLLGSTPTIAHPDRHEFPRFPLMEDMDLLTLRGFDSGVGLFNQPVSDPTCHAVQTTLGRQGTHYVPAAEDDSGVRIVQVPTRFPFASYEINVAQANSASYVKERDRDISKGPFLPRERELEYATLNRRVTMLRSRMDYPLKWAYRRPHEAAEAYQGDIFIHEGVLTFSRDVTLRGDLPIELEKVTYRGGTAYGQADQVVVTDAEKGTLSRSFGPNGRLQLLGTLARGGYLAGQFTTGGALAVLPVMDGMRYQVSTLSTGPKNLRWSYSVGLGRAGQTFKKGDRLPFHYLAVSISGRTPHDDKLLKGLPESLGLAAVAGQHAAQAEVGSITGFEVSLTGQARGRELVARLPAWQLLVNRPVRVRGVQPNGCAAVYVLDGPAWERKFRFVGVFEGEALLQQNTDRGASVWIGNPIYAEDEHLKLTLVMDGLSAGEKPFVEVHNPTDAAIRTVLRSPPHTPHYGGLVSRVQVPAGASIFLPLPPGR